MLDEPEEKVGHTVEITHDGAVEKEILEVGEGTKRPKKNALASVTYRAYFFDHKEFDTSNERPIKIGLGDIAWPEGLWKGIERMRKNEKAKIRIKKKKHAFGRKLLQDKLRFPPGYEEPADHESEEGKAQLEKRQRLLTKGVIYEVKLLDWVDRIDIEGDGNFLKTVLKKAEKKEWEKPSDADEVQISVKLYHFEKDPSDTLEESLKSKEPLIARDHWDHTMIGEEMPLTLSKIL
jgi:FKBP-type peptidyl-prolyl cis-trans isomerase